MRGTAPQPPGPNILHQAQIDVTVKGKKKLTVSGAAFQGALLSVWLGPKPPNAGLKKGLLGQ
jgi:hypothetical protein